MMGTLINTNKKKGMHIRKRNASHITVHASRLLMGMA